MSLPARDHSQQRAPHRALSSPRLRPYSPCRTYSWPLELPCADPATPSASSCRGHIQHFHTCHKIHVHPGPHPPTPLPSPPPCEGPTTLPWGRLIRLDLAQPCAGWNASASSSAGGPGSKTKAEWFETHCFSHNILSFLAGRAKRETLWLRTIHGLREKPDQTGG